MTPAKRIAFLVIAFAAAGNGLAGAAEDDSLWAAIETRPNIVLVMRHADVGPGNGTTYDASGRCRGEVMLTRAGRAQAQAIGTLFEARGFTAEKLNVVASAMCRTRDTATLAFGKAELDPALREFFSGGGGRMNAAMDAAEKWIKKLRGPRPLILITHLPNIDALTAEQPAYGEAVVAEADEQGYLDVLGTLRLY